MRGVGAFLDCDGGDYEGCGGSRPANCQASAAAEDTSITESSPNQISAVEETRVPSVRAMRASITL